MQADVPCQNRFKAAACQTFAIPPATATNLPTRPARPLKTLVTRCLAPVVVFALPTLCEPPIAQRPRFISHRAPEPQRLLYKTPRYPALHTCNILFF